MIQVPDTFYYCGQQFTLFDKREYCLCQVLTRHGYVWCFDQPTDAVHTCSDPLFHPDANVAHGRPSSDCKLTQKKVHVTRLLFITDLAQRYMRYNELSWDVAETNVVDLWYNTNGEQICPCCKGCGKSAPNTMCLYCQDFDPATRKVVKRLWSPVKITQHDLAAPSRVFKSDQETEVIDWNPQIDLWIKSGQSYNAALQNAKSQNLVLVPVLREMLIQPLNDKAS